MSEELDTDTNARGRTTMTRGTRQDSHGEAGFVRYLRGKYLYQFAEAKEAADAQRRFAGTEVWTEGCSGSDVWYSRGYGIVDRIGYVLVSRRPLKGLDANQVWYPGMPGYPE